MPHGATRENKKEIFALAIHSLSSFLYGYVLSMIYFKCIIYICYNCVSSVYYLLYSSRGTKPHFLTMTLCLMSVPGGTYKEKSLYLGLTHMQRYKLFGFVTTCKETQQVGYVALGKAAVMYGCKNER